MNDSGRVGCALVRLVWLVALVGWALVRDGWIGWVGWFGWVDWVGRVGWISCGPLIILRV